MQAKTGKRWGKRSVAAVCRAAGPTRTEKTVAVMKAFDTDSFTAHSLIGFVIEKGCDVGELEVYDDKIKTYSVTFGQQYPSEQHPYFDGAHRGGWVEIDCDSMHAARKIAGQLFGRQYSWIYPPEDTPLAHIFFQDGTRMWPLGCLAAV